VATRPCASRSNFLREKESHARHIITNPPYGGGMADKFIGKAPTFTRRTGGKLAMRLDLAGLCHPTCHARYVDTPPAALYALDELVCLPNGDPDHARFMARAGRRYYWAVWTPGHAGRPSFWWLATAAFKSASPPSPDRRAAPTAAQTHPTKCSSYHPAYCVPISGLTAS
jgi:hypothetical protein